MQKQLQLLRDLQKLDTEIKEVKTEQKKSQDEREVLSSELTRLQEMVEVLDQQISVIESEKSELVNALNIEEGNISRSEGRLPQIKTQKEYIAVLKEIDTAKKLAKEIQGQVDVKNEAITSLKAEKTEKEEELSQVTDANEARFSEIDKKIAQCSEKYDEMDAQRQNLMTDLPTRLRKRYELLMSRRGGVAVVEARGGACLGCHMHLPPQLFNSLYVIKEIQTCPHCNRMLFVNERE